MVTNHFIPLTDKPVYACFSMCQNALCARSWINTPVYTEGKKDPGIREYKDCEGYVG